MVPTAIRLLPYHAKLYLNASVTMGFKTTIRVFFGENKQLYTKCRLIPMLINENHILVILCADVLLKAMRKCYRKGFEAFCSVFANKNAKSTVYRLVLKLTNIFDITRAFLSILSLFSLTKFNERVMSGMSRRE